MSKKLFKTASFIAFIITISKIVGFIRDLVIANKFGASLESDAFFYSYQIPALFLILLGGLNGPFHTATVAFFTNQEKNKNLSHEEVNRIINQFLTYTFMVSCVIAIVIFMFAEEIISLLIIGGSSELKQMATLQLCWMTPVIIIGSLVGVFYGLLSMHGRFLYPSLSPALVSIAVIFAVIWGGDVYGGICLAIGTLIGAFFQLGMQIPTYLNLKYFFYPVFKARANTLKGLGELLFPAMIGTTIGQINTFVDIFFVSGLPEGSWTAIGYANRIVQLVIGILLVSLLVPIFPMFSRFVADKDFDALNHNFSLAVKSLWFIGFPVTVLMLVLGYDGIKVLLQRGSFNDEDTVMVTTALLFLAFSIIPYLARDTITRVFYAYNDTKTPLYVGIAAIIVNIVADWLLVGPFGIGGITLATTIVTIFSLAVLSFLIIKKNKRINILLYASAFGKLSIASFFMGVFVFYANQSLGAAMGTSFYEICIRLCLVIFVGMVMYLLITVNIDKEYRRILGAILSKSAK